MGGVWLGFNLTAGGSQFAVVARSVDARIEALSGQQGYSGPNPQLGGEEALTESHLDLVIGDHISVHICLTTID